MYKKRPKREHFSEKEAQRVGKDLLTASHTVTPEDDVEPDTEVVDFEQEREHYYGPGNPEEWEPPAVVTWNTPGRSGVPYYDDDLDMDVHAAPSSYPAWVAGETYVVTKTLGEGGDFPSRKEARVWAKTAYGGALEEYFLAGRVAFRFYKPGYGTRRNGTPNEGGRN